MTITITTSVKLEPKNQSKLSTILGCTGSAFDQKIEKISSAAIEEYLMMILGDEIFSSINDIQVYRLSRIILQCFPDLLPNEVIVSHLFKITISKSRSLLHSTVSKYQYELDEAITNTICSLVRSVSKLTLKSGQSLLTINTNSRFFIELMNEKVASLDVTLPYITRRPFLAGVYEIQQSTYDALVKFCTTNKKKKSKNG